MNWSALSLFASKTTPICKGKLVVWSAANDQLQDISPNSIIVLTEGDLDEKDAQQLIDSKVRAVIHCGHAMSGYIPTQGPLLLLQQQILIWEISTELNHLCVSDMEVSLHQNYMMIGKRRVACRLYEKEAWLRDQQAANEHAVNRQELFLKHTLSRALMETRVLFKPLPKLNLYTKFEGRPVFVVSTGKGSKVELEAAIRIMRRLRPVVVGVGEGAVRLIASGITPHIVITERHRISEQARTCGAEIIIHSSSSEEELLDHSRWWDNPTYHELHCAGSNEDAALRLAYEQGCECIITFGVNLYMKEYIAEGHAEMGNSLLVRSMVGDRLVDFKHLSILQSTSQLPQKELLSTIVLSAVFIGLSFFQLHWILKRAAHTVWKLVGLQ